MSASAGVEQLLEDKRICVCAGSGGVGKTTTAAAVAVGMAAAGARVVVLTIDPAKRLAQSLGLEELGNEPRRVEPERLAAGGTEPRGELWAMMLDPKRTFDHLVEKYSDPESRDRILANRIYREVSTAIAGSQEYMAMERLYELHEEGGFDLLVLDTPPTRNALDFLDAPERLSRFIGSRALSMFLSPGRGGLRLIGRGTGLVLSLLKRVTGADLLEDLADFFQALSGMAGGFRERARRVNELLADSGTAFLLVTSPRRDAVDEAIFFRRRLGEGRMPFAGVVVNRVQEPLPAVSAEDVAGELAPALGEELARKVAANLDGFRALADGDARSIALLEAELEPGAPILRVPLLDQDVHDVEGLRTLGGHLFGGAAARAKASRA